MAVITRASKVTAKSLKEVYHQYMDLLNYGMEWIENLKVAGMDYKGRTLIVPIRLKKFVPGKYQTETESMQTPVAGETTFLEFDAVLFIARMATTWMAQEFDGGNVVPISDDLKHWISANNESLEYAAIYGGKTRGIISEFPEAALSNVAQNDNAGIGAFRTAIQELDYDGDFGPFKLNGASGGGSSSDAALLRYNGIVTVAPVLGTPSSWVPVDLRCLDDYLLVAADHGITGAGNADTGLYVVAINELTSTITIVLASRAATPSLELRLAITQGVGMAVELRETTAIKGPLADRNFGNVNVWSQAASKEMQGILSNLYGGTLGGKDRSLGANAALRSKNRIVNTALGGGRAALAASRVVELLDITEVDAKKPSTLWVNPLFNSIYIASFSTAIQLNQYDGGQKGFDSVPKATTLAGYTPKTLRRLPRGMILFTTPDSWMIITPKRGGGLGGAPFLKFRNSSSGVDDTVTPTTVTTILGIHNQVCTEPRKNATLCGIHVVQHLAD